MADVAHGSPTKDFFISMITKYIGLEDCILDLLDNSIDGVSAFLKRLGEVRDRATFYAGFWVDIELSKERFQIVDNCGGIPLESARDYAFHFGRRRGADPGASYSIGLYGIGMKRAIFKIGRKIEITSSTETAGFRVPIDVEDWARPDNDANWDFAMHVGEPTTPGTAVTITELNKGVDEEFATEAFANGLNETIARDYSFFIQRGLKVRVNEAIVKPYAFALLEGGDFEPVRID